MSDVQSLDELKAQNAAEEAAMAQPEAEEIEAEEAPELEAEQPETTEGGEAEESEEDWLKEDSAEEEKKQSDLVPAAVLAETRRKLRGQVSEKDAEIQRLKSELDQVKASPAATSAQDLDLEIALESWEYEGDNYARYKAELDARNARKIMQAESARAQQAQQIEQQQREIAEQFNQHYDRVEQFISSGKMTVEKYKAAEANVISKLNELTGAGEVVMKKFIAGMGKGSEKVITHLGLNSASQQRLEQELRRDQSGIAAAIYLGELRKTFDSPPVTKPKTAPTPDVPLTGKAPITSADKAAYDKAHAAKNPEKAFAIKQAAKEKGINTSEW